MNVVAEPHMNVDEFLDWAVGRPGRYELFRGEVLKISPETAGHTGTKGAVYIALAAALRRCCFPCHALPNGLIVRIDETTAYEPDAVVYCGQKIVSSALEITNPAIIIEVLSQAARRVQTSFKLVGYFRLPSVAHYLIADPTQPSIIHHSRGSGDTILTRVITEGRIAFDPPGLEIDLADIYE
jgi:Uma2 family endonuclease